ncbi:MAG: hypothetical protein ACI358_01960 [Candidatus Limimorpha sp.]
MKTLFNSLTVLMICLAVFSCKGPKGDQGPVGPAGNANVFSAVVDTRPNNWIWDSGGCNWYVDFDWVDGITPDIVDNGAVLVYMENPNPSYYAWHQLPLTLYISDEYSSTVETTYYDGGLSLFWTNSDLNEHLNPCSALSTDVLSFKVVAIDGYAFSNNSNCDFSDYEAVKRTFNLED